MSQLGAMFDKDPAVLAAFQQSRARFEAFAANDVTDPPPADPIDAIQIDLMRWQRARFGDAPDAFMALGMIEEMVETFIADKPTDTEDAIDGLGDTCVYAAQLCTANRLALGPILDLARVFTSQQSIRLLIAHGVLAQVVLKMSQKIRGMDDRDRAHIRLVGAIALCIARTLESVEMLHDIVAKPGEVLLVVAREVLARGEGHDGIPKPVASEATRQIVTPEERERMKHERRAAAVASVHNALEGFDPDSEPVCLHCGGALSAIGAQDLWRCTADTEHVFTGKQLAAGAKFDTSDVRIPDEEITKPE